MFKIINIILISTVLFSCSPERKLKRANRKLARLIEHNPQLVKSDTIYKQDTIKIPEKNISGKISINKDYGNLDSLLSVYFNKNDSLGSKSYQDTVIKNIKNIIINTPILKDTVRVDSLGMHFKIYQSGNSLQWSFKVDEEEIIKKYAQQIRSTNPIKYINKKEWWESGLMIVGALALIFIALDLYASYRK